MHALPMLTFPVLPSDMPPCAPSLWSPVFPPSLQCGLATAAWDAVHHLGLLLYHQGVLHFGQHGAEGLSRPEDNLHAKLPADPFDILTDPFYVGEHHQWGSVLFFQWQCLSCLHVLSGWFGRGADESTGVPVLPQDSGEVVLFLPQVVLPSGDGSGSVEQAFDQSPLDLGWMVGVEVKVPVCVYRSNKVNCVLMSDYVDARHRSHTG